MLRRVGTTLILLTVLGAILACAQVYRNSGTQALQSKAPDTLRLATYNVHYIILERETGDWSVEDWHRRKGPLQQAFQAINADAIAFQEMESFAWNATDRQNLALDWLLQNNPAYAAAAAGDPAVFPSTQPILYRTDRLTLLDQGWFFFSETPEVIYSRTFNGSYPAFASWAQFEDRVTHTQFRLINIHTDFSSTSNRLKSVALVAQRITPWIDADETVYVVGDLNARHGAETLQIIENTGVVFAPIGGSTYHFNMGLNLFGAIDHIGYVGETSPAGPPVVIREKFADEWPTDHYPVVVDFERSS